MKLLQQGLALMLVCGLLSACASSARNVTPAYVSPLVFKGFTCSQIRSEAGRIMQEVAKLTGKQDDKATNDAVATGVAIVLFFPAAFFISGDNHVTAELAQLKGRFKTLRAESERKRCKIKFRSLEEEDEKERAKERAVINRAHGGE